MKINQSIKLSDKIIGASPLLNKIIDKDAQTVLIGRTTRLGAYSIDKMALDNIILPSDICDLDLTISGTDINYNLFATKFSNYIGEPIFLCYGNNKKDTLENLYDVKVEYAHIDDVSYHKLETDTEVILQKEFRKGDDYKDNLFTSTITSSLEDANKFYQSGAYVYYEDDKLVVHSSTLWSHFIKRAVANMLNISDDKVVVKNYAQGLSLSLDLIDAIFYSCYVAIVTYKTKKPSYLLLDKDDEFFYSPKRSMVKAYYEAKLSPRHGFEFFRAIIKIDVGNQAILGEEILNKMAVKLLGDPYAKENYHITIMLVKTATPPSFALSTLGESSLIFTLETFINLFLTHLDYSIILGRANLYYKENEVNSLGITSKIPSILSLLSLNVLKESSFDKKRLAYSFLANKKTIQHNFPILNAKSIGFAHGVLGGHFLNPKLRQNKINIVLIDEDHIEIQTSVSLSQIMILKEWQNLISYKLMIPISNIFFTISDTSQTPDSGPIMEDFFSIISNIINQSINEIAVLDKKDLVYPYIISKTFNSNDSWDNEKLKGSPYLMQSAISTVVEIDFDFCSFETSIRHLYFSISCAKILNKTILLNHLETEILQTIDWIMGEKPYFLHGKIPDIILSSNLAKRKPHLPTYSIIIEENEDLNHEDFSYGFYGGLINSTLPAAYLQAINQVLNLDLRSLPQNEKDLFELYNKRHNITNKYHNVYKEVDKNEADESIEIFEKEEYD